VDTLSHPSTQAGLVRGLPFLLLLLAFSPQADGVSPDQSIKLEFQQFESSCINLGHYDRRTRRLTLRFVGSQSNRFYRYSNVAPQQWAKMTVLNKTGGVGNYLNKTVLADPRKHPFEEVVVTSFTTTVRGKKKSQ
jgi:hypothetical protein